MEENQILPSKRNLLCVRISEPVQIIFACIIHSSAELIAYRVKTLLEGFSFAIIYLKA